MSDQSVTHPTEVSSDLPEQMKERRTKLEAIRSHRVAYPNDFKPEHTASPLLHEHEKTEAAVLEEQPIVVSLAGRIMQRRIMGKASFVHIQDRTGRIQLYIQQEVLGVEGYEEFRRWDIGDIVGITGRLFRTKTGELSVRIQTIRLLTKALRPLPDKFHGLTDPELRNRKRYLDIMMNPHSRQVFLLRSQATRAIREYLSGQDFLEVETPMMQILPGGAVAKPFVTHHHALGRDLYLRIAPELYLKRLVVGGFERVFELNRNFRNEGISTRHNPEFTMLEYYEAYADYEDAMTRLEQLIRHVVNETVGPSLKVPCGSDELDFSKPFERLEMTDAILRYHPDLSRQHLDDLPVLKAYVSRFVKNHVALEIMSVPELQLALFEETVESALMAPTFITGYPTAVSPLARAHDQDPSKTERFELFVVGRELANGFSELNDPDDQAARFLLQAKRREIGDEEAMCEDQDYIEALEYGLPPTAGVGIGMDRLVMLLANVSSIRDVILFPHMRPQE